MKKFRWNLILPQRKNYRLYRNRAIIYTLIETGMRRNAITNLNLVDIDFDRRILTAVEKGGSVQLYPISKQGVTAISDYLEHERAGDQEKWQSHALFQAGRLKSERAVHALKRHTLKYLENMKLRLFTDGSVNTKLRVGYGAYLALSEGQEPQTGHIKLKQFVDTSSTKLELQTLLWALSEISAPEVTSYTDSQNIVGLNSRRKKIEENHYYAKNGKLLNNHELYKQFYQLTDNLNITFTPVRGHIPSNRKSHVDLIFSMVDRASRNAIRAYSTNSNLEFSAQPPQLE